MLLGCEGDDVEEVGLGFGRPAEVGNVGTMNCFEVVRWASVGGSGVLTVRAEVLEKSVGIGMIEDGPKSCHCPPISKSASLSIFLHP